MNFRRLFCALIAGLVVLAAGMIYSASRPAAYTATAVVHLSEPADDVDAGADTVAGSLAAEMASHDNLLVTLAAIERAKGRAEDASQGNASQKYASQEARREALANSMRTTLEVALGRDGQPDEKKLSVQYTGSDRQAAVQVVNEVARQMASQYADALIEGTRFDYDVARSDASAAHQEWTEAQTALDEALAAHLEAVKSPASSSSSNDVMRLPAVGATIMPAKESPPENPIWLELSAQLASVEADLAELRDSKTAAHPLVLAAAWRLAQLKGQLEQTQRFLMESAPREVEPTTPQVFTNNGNARWREATPDGDHEVAAASEKPSATVSGASLSGVTAAAATVKQRQEHLATAADRYQAAVAAEQAAWGQLTAAQAALDGNVQTATIGDLIGQESRSPIPLPTAIASLLVALGIAVPRRSKDRVLTTVDDARKRLSMPILGVISAT